ncbi:MAG TPA: anthranilate phosphoribosyltransferase [Gemmatimonadales bacterium]|jgi:anthranilate phosphoribosyltransferase|nr:anthranilate phosphoribosyltransferase [Gemmatimonadales bacterium]
MPVTQVAALRHAVQQLAEGASLSSESAAAAFAALMRGEATPVEAAALLMGLRTKGETADEVAGAASALRLAMVRVTVDHPERTVDTCGTGGGRVGTLNLSTAAAFVVAGAGVPVAKHGNRSFTSRSGSADVLEALGVNIQLTAERASAVLREAGLVFLFAPGFHPAMRHVAPVRKELGVPTIMNLLGPLVNPASVTRQVVGVADRQRAPLVAEALARLQTTHALVLHAEVGMDEVSPCGPTHAWEVCGGVVTEWAIDPWRHGLECEDLDDLAGGEPAENARRIERLLAGGDGAPAIRCAVLLNAAAGLYVSGRGWTFEESVQRAKHALDHGAGGEALERLRRASRR